MGVKLEPFTTWDEFVTLAESVSAHVTLSGSDNKFRLPVLGITHANASGNSSVGLFMYPGTTGNGRFAFNNTEGVYNLLSSNFAANFVGGGFMVVPD